MFTPVRAYRPAGTLREVVAYPHPLSNFDPAEIAKALADVGLEHLKAELDVEDRWDRLLTDDEKQSVAFARVDLQEPNWCRRTTRWIFSTQHRACESETSGRVR